MSREILYLFISSRDHSVDYVATCFLSLTTTPWTLNQDSFVSLGLNKYPFLSYSVASYTICSLVSVFASHWSLGLNRYTFLSFQSLPTPWTPQPGLFIRFLYDM